MTDRTGLDLTEEEREELYEEIQRRFEFKQAEWIEEHGRFPTPEEKAEIVNEIAWDWYEGESEELEEEWGYYGDIEFLTDLENFLYDYQEYWNYTVYYQQGEQNGGDHS